MSCRRTSHQLPLPCQHRRPQRPAPRTACSCLADALHASSICKQGLVPLFLCACRVRWLTFSHLVGGACLALYQAEQRETLTAALFSVQCGYPTGILGPLARAVGNPCWVTMGNDDGAHCARAGLWNTALLRPSPGPHRTRATNSPIRSVGRDFV